MQLGKLLEEVYVSCGLQVLRRKATGGTTTTIVDTGMINRRPDGYFAQGANGGHILFMSQTTDFNTLLPFALIDEPARRSFLGLL